MNGVQARRARQWDLWFPDYDLPVGHGQTARLPVLVGVPCYSRFILADMIGSKESADVLGGHLRLLVELGAVPRVGVYDGEPAISVRRGRKLIYTEDYLRGRRVPHGLLGGGIDLLGREEDDGAHGGAPPAVTVSARAAAASLSGRSATV